MWNASAIWENTQYEKPEEMESAKNFFHENFLLIFCKVYY